MHIKRILDATSKCSMRGYLWKWSQIYMPSVEMISYLFSGGLGHNWISSLVEMITMFFEMVDLVTIEFLCWWKWSQWYFKWWTWSQMNFVISGNDNNYFFWMVDLVQAFFFQHKIRHSLTQKCPKYWVRPKLFKLGQNFLELGQI